VSAPARLVWRYGPAQRWVHWCGVAYFATLFATGLVLAVPQLGFLAAGGLSRLLHRIAGISFVLLPIVYAIAMPGAARELIAESLSYGEDDGRWLRRMPAYVLGRATGLPPQGRLNAGQKLHHAGTFTLFVIVAASGAALWLGKGRLGAAGLAWTAMAHDLSVLGLAVLLVGHVYFTFLHGGFSAMRTGWVTEEYARLEHARWVEGLPPEAFVRDERDPDR
jgi:formate dehydrogenase subunit gamma